MPRRRCGLFGLDRPAQHLPSLLCRSIRDRKVEGMALSERLKRREDLRFLVRAVPE